MTDPEIDRLLSTDVLAAIETKIASQQDAGDEETRAFYIQDVSQIDKTYCQWTRELPSVSAFYAVKCNPDRGLLKRLAQNGAGFDCASLGELRTVLDLGVSASRIIYTNPVKTPTSLRFARKVGVRLLVFDNDEELQKIKEVYPEATLLLRIAVKNPSAVIQLSDKFGAESPSSSHLLRRAVDLGMDVAAISFHVGTATKDLDCFSVAISEAISLAKDADIDLRILDIGGGFTSKNFAQAACRLRQEITGAQEMFPNLQAIAEPGRFLACPAFTLACQVIGKRGEKECTPPRLYLNDGIFGNFINAFFEKQEFQPCYVIRGNAVKQQSTSGPYEYSLWGPTCDSSDRIATNAKFDETVETGDWLVFADMGAYTSVCQTGFNGFDTHVDVVYV